MPAFQPQLDLYSLLVLGAGAPLLGLLLWAGFARLAIGASVSLVIAAVVAAGAGLSASMWLPAVGLTAGVGLVIVCRNYRHQLLSAIGARAVPAVVLALTAPLMAWSWSSHFQAVWPDAEPDQTTASSKSGAPIATSYVSLPSPVETQAVTDRGNTVLLGKSFADPIPPEMMDETEQWAIQHCPLTAVQTAPRDAASNCYGWVFTGGRYWVHDSSIDTILEDNGYAPVSRPKAGDVVIYRDDAGRATHAGLVRLSIGETVIVESKWGARGRFLHRPEAQCFGQTWTYYHTSRKNHTLRIQEGEGFRKAS